MEIRERAKKIGGLAAVVTTAGGMAAFGSKVVAPAVAKTGIYKFIAGVVAPVVDTVSTVLGFNVGIPFAQYAAGGALALVGAKAARHTYDSIVDNR